MLLGQFDSATCAQFKKQVTKKDKAHIAHLTALINEVQEQPPNELRDQKLAELTSFCNAARHKSENKALRVDVSLVDHDTGNEVYVDTTCIHPTCKSRIKDELKRTTERLSDPRNPKLRAGFAVEAQTEKKHTDYQPLVDVARKQLANGRRTSAPTFYAAVVSTYGELGQETVKLQEWLTSAYGRRLDREGPRDDGTSRARLTAAFRNHFRLRMLTAVAKGLGAMLNSAGFPLAACKKY